MRKGNVVVLAIGISLLVTSLLSAQTTAVDEYDLLSSNSGLSGWYPMDNGIIRDLSFYNGSTKIYGATPALDQFGNPKGALSFDGKDDHAIIFKSISPRKLQGMTVFFLDVGQRNQGNPD